MTITQMRNKSSKGSMMISKKAIPRRMMLRGLGASVALPFLDSMVPALSALGTTAAAPTVRFGAVYVPNGMVMQNWTPARRGGGVRADTDSPAAGAVQRPAAGAVRAQLHPTARLAGRNALPGRDTLSDRRAPGSLEHPSDLDGPDRGQGTGAAYPAGVPRARAGRRQFCWVVRQRWVQLRLLVHDFLEELGDPVADGAQPASGVRAVVRRQRDDRSGGAAGADAGSTQHSRFGERRGGQATPQPGGRPTASRSVRISTRSAMSSVASRSPRRRGNRRCRCWRDRWVCRRASRTTRPSCTTCSCWRTRPTAHGSPPSWPVTS